MQWSCLALAGMLAATFAGAPQSSAIAQQPPIAALPPLPADSPRNTPTVKLIERSLPSVVAIRSVKQVGKDKANAQIAVSLGSGSVIHPAGYILTNNHVVQNMLRGTVQFPDGTTLPYRVVAGLPSEDLAVIKVDAAKPLPIIPLGRSDDLRLGEPTLALGTPGGLSFSASTGIISGLNRSAMTAEAALQWLVQTTVAISGGSSGGPLINAEGDQIGVIAARKDGLEGVGFAIAIDRVRHVLPQVIAPEQRFGFSFGAEFDPLSKRATVTRVEADSPCALAGIAKGDIVLKIGDNTIANGVDVSLALFDRRVDDSLSVELLRDEKPMKVSVNLKALKLAEPSMAKVVPGLKLNAFYGKWDKLPDFSALKPVGQGTAAKPTAITTLPKKDEFGLRFTGYLRVPTEGLYNFSLVSDDGSKLTIHGKTVIDHDGLHGAYENTGLLRLKAGLHPIQVDYFEAAGSEGLKLSWEGPGIEKQEIPAEAYFTEAP